jgi:hypoxia up-regulated 1
VRSLSACEGGYVTYSYGRLSEQEAKELAVSMREEQRNALEAYIYRTRDVLAGDSDHPFIMCSKEGERKALSQQLEEVARWFSDHQETAETKDFLERRLSIQCVLRLVVGFLGS